MSCRSGLVRLARNATQPLCTSAEPTLIDAMPGTTFELANSDSEVEDVSPARSGQPL